MGARMKKRPQEFIPYEIASQNSREALLLFYDNVQTCKDCHHLYGIDAGIDETDPFTCPNCLKDRIRLRRKLKRNKK